MNDYNLKRNFGPKHAAKSHVIREQLKKKILNISLKNKYFLILNYMLLNLKKNQI